MFNLPELDVAFPLDQLEWVVLVLGQWQPGFVEQAGTEAELRTERGNAIFLLKAEILSQVAVDKQHFSVHGQMELCEVQATDQELLFWVVYCVIERRLVFIVLMVGGWNPRRVAQDQVDVVNF